MGNKYDIFISYRRQGGESTARILCERFTDLGYRVFFDVESLRSGDFNADLYSVIEQCKDFLIVLSPGALDRCVSEDDWVRLEIAHALKHNKNIIPIMLRGFSFPDNLPKEIDALRYKNGLEANNEFFDAFIGKLQGFLHTKASVFSRIVQNSVLRKTMPFLIAFAITIAAVLGGTLIYNRFQDKGFPYDTKDKNIAGELLYHISSNLNQYNFMIRSAENAYRECSNYLASASSTDYENTRTTINRTINDITKIDLAQNALSEQLSGNLDGTPIDKANVLAFDNTVLAFQEEVINDLRYMNYVLSYYTVFDLNTSREIVYLYRQKLDLSAKYAVYVTNYIVVDIDDAFLTDFKNALLPLTSLPFEGFVWLTDKQSIDNQLTINLNKLSDIISELASIVGGLNVEYANELEDYRRELEDGGLSPEQIDEILSVMAKSANNALMLQEEMQKKREEIQVAKDDIAQMLEEAKTKFAPLETDDIYDVWGKMLRFLNLGLYDDAIRCAQFYQQKARLDDVYADKYIPIVINYIKDIKNTGIDYGIMVVDFESGITEHEIYQIGDIIIAVNDRPCINLGSYAAFDKKAGDKITLLRQNETGGFDHIDVFTVENQSKAGMMELTEKDD